MALGLEGGHHKRRILHAGGDSTGKWITEFVISKVNQQDNIEVFENTTLLDLLIEDGVCYGVRCWSENEKLQATESKAENGCEVLRFANHVVLTSGGPSAISMCVRIDAATHRPGPSAYATQWAGAGVPC